MRYLTLGRAASVAEAVEQYLEEGNGPVTERLPKVAEEWARRMNDAPEPGACPACNRPLKSD